MTMTVTLRLPDDTCQRMKQLAADRGISLNKLMEELGTAAAAAHDAELRFRTLAANADRQRALAILDRLDDFDLPTRHQTPASMLYRIIAEEARAVDDDMAEEGKGIFHVPEIWLAFSVGRAMVRHKPELFGDRKVDIEWDAACGPLRRVDMKLTAGDEVMLFEFKRGSTSTSDAFLQDLLRLTRPPKQPPVRRFFCAMIDEFLRKPGNPGRISSLEHWDHAEFRAVPVVREFTVLPKRRHPRVGPTHCIVGLWELVPK